jgi:asparagine synthetase B (glutamine-hydrolysing)
LSSLRPEALRSLLTLRYYRFRTDEETIPYNEWTDFQPQPISLDNALLRLNKLIDQKLPDTLSEVSLLFSGGLDSSFLLSKLKGKTHVSTITLTYRKDVPTTLKEALDFFKPDETHTVDLNTILKDLQKQIRIQGYPLWHLYSYYVMEKASSLGMPVITGDGADEVLAGYEFRYKSFFQNPLDTPQKRVDAYLRGHNRDWVPNQSALFAAKIKFSWRSIQDLLIEYFQNPLPALRQVFLADYHGKLRWDWIPMYKKWARHFNLAIISPFLEQDTMQFGHHLPTELLFDGGKGKVLLRESLRRLGAPQEIVDQPKSGFGLRSLDDLWINEGKAIFSSLYFARVARVVEAHLIRQKWVEDFRERLSDYERDPRYLSKALQLIAFETWYRILEGESRNDDRE